MARRFSSSVFGRLTEKARLQNDGYLDTTSPVDHGTRHLGALQKRPRNFQQIGVYAFIRNMCSLLKHIHARTRTHVR